MDEIWAKVEALFGAEGMRELLAQSQDEELNRLFLNRGMDLRSDNGKGLLGIEVKSGVFATAIERRFEPTLNELGVPKGFPDGQDETDADSVDINDLRSQFFAAVQSAFEKHMTK
jgi:hypothetical protein